MTDELEVRLKRLEAERDILQTLHGYGHALDYGDEERFMDCWAPGATLIWPGTGAMTGHDALRAAFRAHTHIPDAFHKHFMVEPLIRIAEAEASVESMFARLDLYVEGPQVRSFGRYRDSMIRCSDGRWRFQKRIAEVEARRPGTTPTVDRAALPNTRGTA